MFIVILNMFKVATKTNVYVVDDPYGQRKEATRTSRDPSEVSFIVQKVTKIHIYRYNKQTSVANTSTHFLWSWCSDHAHATLMRPSPVYWLYGHPLNVLAPPTEHTTLSVNLT